MKWIFRTGAAAALATLPIALSGQTAPTAPAPAPAPAATVDADPALWVVRDDDTTIYLLGTVHVLKPGLSWFDEGVRKAFDASDEVVLELVMTDPAQAQALVTKLAVNPTGPSLTDKLPADKRDAYARAITGLGFPATAFDRVDPWFAVVNIAQMSLMKAGYDITQGVEPQVTAAAAAAGKPVTGLETMEQQLGYFDNLSQPAQVQLLTSTVDDLAQIGPETDRMVGYWGKGDPEALARMMNDSLRESPELSKVLLNDRNERWATWIEARLAKPGTVFMAVGAGHLAGPDSVQAKLAKLKLKATRVKY